MLSARFELFEFICTELAGQDDCVITNEDLGVETEERSGGRFNGLLDNLRGEHDAPDNQTAIAFALRALEDHFGARRSLLPFSYDLKTRKFTSLDKEFIRFISEVTRGAAQAEIMQKSSRMRRAGD